MAINNSLETPYTEEKELIEFIITVGKIGKIHKRIINLAEKIAAEKEIVKSDKFTNGWLARFMLCHLEFSLRKGDCTSQTRMSAKSNRHVIEQCFAVLKECMEKFDLMNEPNQTYNF